MPVIAGELMRKKVWNWNKIDEYLPLWLLVGNKLRKIILTKFRPFKKVGTFK
jgi:hypothetical protein